MLLATALVLGACGSTGGATGGTSTTEGGQAAATTAAATSPGGTNLVVDGKVTDAALATMVGGDGKARPGVVDSIIARVASRPVAEQDALRTDLALRVEQEAARLSGIEAALGGPAPTETALRGAWAQVSTAYAAFDPKAPLQPAPKPVPGKAHLPAADGPSQGTAGGTGVLGVFLGMMSMALVADLVVSAANNMSADAYGEHSTPGAVISASVEQSTVELEFKGTQDGVDVTFKASAVVHPCPKADGSFDIEIKVDVRTAKGTAGNNVTVDVNVTGQVDDEAELVSTTVDARTQWADFDKGKGQYLDVTTHRKGDAFSIDVNRSAGSVTDGFVKMAILIGEMFAVMTTKQFVEAAKAAWQSGRCVRLDLTASPGPTGLAPSATSKISANPRSKIDGAATGGKVTAKLSSGGASVEPSNTKVTADATFTYTAPDEKNESGTVDAESRSKRGVGKGSITLDTKAAAYQIVGGLDDFQVNQAVCDILAPFTLSDSGFSVNFSGGLAGTYTYTGVFAAAGSGTYSITLPDGVGKPGTMVGQGPGVIAGASGSGTEHYTLTPLEKCG